MIKKDRKKKSKLPRYGRALENARNILVFSALFLALWAVVICFGCGELLGRKTNEKNDVDTPRVLETYAPELLEFMLDRLVAEISPDGKTPEQICRAIYDTVRERLVYTGSSEKGDIHRAAYYALVGGGGDCYSFYALTSLLLDRCGIENLGIERLSKTDEGTHFWNFVNIGTRTEPRWYHLDTTPINAGKYTFSGCLLTDRQIEAYSKIRQNFYLYDKSAYPRAESEIITPTPTLEELY